MGEQKSRNVFVSHHHKDEEGIKKMKALLKKRSFQIKNSSIDSTKPNQASNPEYIKRLLRLRIKWSGAMVVLIGKDTHTRSWVDWEIKKAFEKGKRIVGVFQDGAKEEDVPQNLEFYGDALVGWHSEKIIGGIEGNHNDWCKPSGEKREPKWKTERVVC